MTAACAAAPADCGSGCLVYSFILLSLSAALLLVGALIIIFAFKKEDRAKEMISLLRSAPDSIDILKKTYTPGTRIRLDLMGDDPDPIKSGETGTVVLVDDIGTIHVDWDCGRRLGVVPGIDSFHSLDEPVRDAGKEL